MSEAERNYFFVDEAGDLTLFGRRGKCLLGTPGVSGCFMVGMAHVLHVSKVEAEMGALHRRLLADSYLSGIPSMHPDTAKTARCFHAKDDCPEVRMQVFKLLAEHDIKVQVALRRKRPLLEEARASRPKGRRWENEVYDNLVKTLFKRSLHKAPSIIYFARRGKSAREETLRQAIEQAKENFRWRFPRAAADQPVDVIPSVPSQVVGLQVIDYFLWALQRLYERGEDRYFSFLREHYRLIMDFDDKRNNRKYGEWYSDDNPLTKEKIQPVTG